MTTANRRQVEITNSFGFHLRAACRFVQLCQKSESDVRVFCDGRAAHGSSVVDLMMLAAGNGALLELEATGPDAEAATCALCTLIEKEFPRDLDRPG
jgi:phosphocarrier protein